MKEPDRLKDWQDLATTSHYLTVLEIENVLAEEDLDATRAGLDALKQALSRVEKRALTAQLVRLMAHILKWKTQPHKRSRSWIVSIYDARNEIADSQEEVPSLNQTFIETIWPTADRRARQQAENETGAVPVAEELTWEEVFEAEYYLPEE